MFNRFFFMLLVLVGFSTTMQAQPDPNNPCDPVLVSQITTDLIAQGATCLDGAGPFACVEDVFNYAFTNCPPVIDTTGGGGWDPCDDALVSAEVANLIAMGFTCLENAGPFDCVEDVYNYLNANCAPPVDTSGCDPIIVAQVTADLIAQGATCLDGAGPFACVEDVFNFAFTNCPPVIDTTGGGGWDPCDPAVVSAEVANLLAMGFTCLENAGPFACIEDVYNYINANCTPPVDSSGCDPILVAQVTADLIAQGATCLDGSGPFECIEDVFNYAYTNCPPVDTSFNGNCDPVYVAEFIQQLITEGYTCLEGAGPFECEHDALCYALENCPLPYDTTVVPLPACFLDMPTTITTFQQAILYILANCDSTIDLEIPACWLDAPIFDTDEEFMEWIAANCDDFNGLMTNGGPVNAMMNAFFAPNSPLSTDNYNTLEGVTMSPNPASTATEIRLDGGAIISSVEVMDMTGKQLITIADAQKSSVNVSLNSLPAGLLLVRITDENGKVATKKLVKQ